jgi:hypothetical protein
MARPEKAITSEGPVADLAIALRELRKRAGNPPYKCLAELASYSRAHLSDAARGNTCPAWEVVEAFARGMRGRSG